METAAVERRRWTIAILLGVGVLVNYFDRVNLSVSHDALVKRIRNLRSHLRIPGGAYNWTYAACQLPSGVLLDRFGVRRVGSVSTLIWSIASFAAATARGMTGFFGARFLLGVGEAPTFPANAKAIGYWFPPRGAQLSPPACSTALRNSVRPSAYRSSACCCYASVGA